jgi:hypothetical protein
MVLALSACTARLDAPGAIAGAGAADEPEPATSGPDAPPEPSDPGRGPETPVPDLRPLDPLVRRLTKDEYVYTVEDRFELTLSADDRRLLPDDRPLEGFVNIATGQSALPDHAWAYARVAERVATSPEAGVFIAAHGCGSTSTACGRAFVRSAGTALFRGPPSDPVVQGYAAVFDAAVAEGLDFESSARWTLRALLQAPEFLYRLEDETKGTEPRTVGGYEMATRLSYLLWATAPDAALMEAAANGALDTPDGVLAQTERLLSDADRVNRVLDRFILDWSGLESIPDDDGLKSELQRSTIAFYEDFVARGGDLFALLTEPSAHLTPALAEAYGLEPTGPGVRAYDLRDAPNRGGLLGQPGVLAGMTNADGGAIVARGLFLQRQLFCGDTPDPPASLQESIDRFAAEQPPDASERQIADVRMQRNECAVCHSAFDPLAYGFERFDHRGAVRAEDEHGNALRTDGWIPAIHAGGADVAYAGFDDYMRQLEQTPGVKRCLVQRQLEYALGSRLDEAQTRAVLDVVDALEVSGGTYGDLIRALVVHDVFRTAARPEEEI